MADMGFTLDIDTIRNARLAAETLIKADREIVDGIRSIVKRYGQKLYEEAAKDARDAKSGVKYPVLPNRSSAPGETPAEQSGLLLFSIIETYAKDGLSVTAGPTVDYAVYLHEGKKGQPDTKRPIMEPALARLTGPFQEEIYAVLRGVGN